MTEAKWLVCTDPQEMLESLRGKGSERKLRLFGVACCSRVWGLLPDKEYRDLVALVERYADNPVKRNHPFRRAERIYDHPQNWPHVPPTRTAWFEDWHAQHAVLHLAGVPPGAIRGDWGRVGARRLILVDASHQCLSPVSLSRHAAESVASALARHGGDAIQATAEHE
jgi:hypothetical protein